MPITEPRAIPERGRWLPISKLYIFISIILLTCSGRGEEIRFEGGSATDQRDLSRLIRAVDYDLDSDSVQAFLADRGYFDAVISSDSSGIAVIFGDKSKVGRIIVQNKNYDTVSVDEYFDRSIIEKSIREILNRYQKNGHFYANLRPIQYDRRGGYIDIIVELQPGPAITISQIELDGLKKTDPDHIARYIDVKSGDTLDSEELEQSYERLRQLDYITIESPPEIIPEEGYNRARIVYRFLEKKRVSVEGSGGYVPEDDGYFMWYFNGRLRNIFGQGRFVELLIDRREKDKAIFRFNYTQPTFLLGQGRTGIGISTRDYRKQFYEFALTAFYDIDLTQNSSLGVNLEWKDVEPEPADLPSYNIYGVGVRLQSGEVRAETEYNFQSSLDWRITYLSRKYDIGGESDSLRKSTYEDTRIDLTAEISKRLFGALHGYGRLIVRDVESGEKPLPLSELVLFGGPGTIRGYRNDRYNARRLFVTTLEPRLFWDSHSYLFPFYDAAYYEYYRIDNDSVPGKFDGFLYGYGIGVNFGSATRKLILSLSWGKDTAVDEPRLNVTVSDQF